MSVMGYTEYAWLKLSGSWAVNRGDRRHYHSGTATHDRRVAKRVCRRAGIRWKRVTQQASANARRLYWFDDDDLMRWQASAEA